MKSLLFLVFLAGSMIANAQFPSTSTLLADVKKQNPAEFETISLVGTWNLFHDKAPTWQAPDACRHQVDIVGKKKADGSYWTYSALAIYSKAGSAYSFNRLFLLEDATRLHGIDLPDNAYFKQLFLDKLESKDPMLLTMNYELKNATAFYSFEVKNSPKLTGSGTNLIALYTVEVTLDLPNGSRLERKTVPIEVKAAKNGKDFSFQHALKKSDGTLIESKDLGSSETAEQLPKYGFNPGNLAAFTRTEQSYAVPAGSNGEGMPTDTELIQLLEKTFLTSKENFSILFGPNGASIMTAVQFLKKETKNVSSGQLTAVFTVEYEFFNEKIQEQSFKVITAQRALETQFVLENGTWYVDQSTYLNEAVYTKTEPIAWPYRNSYKEKTLEKTLTSN